MVSSDEGRLELLNIRQEAAQRLIRVFPALDFKRLDETAPRWMVEVEIVVAAAHAEAEAVAEDAYQATRRAADAAGSVAFARMDLDRGKLRTSLRVLGPYAAKRQLAGGALIPDVAATVLANTTGSALKDALRPGRDGVRRTVRRDPAAVGWRRFASAGACKFCRMVADKGAVYRQSTATFAAHLHCACTAAPVFAGGEVGPEASVMQYLASTRSRTPSERARLRSWLDTAYPD